MRFYKDLALSSVLAGFLLLSMAWAGAWASSVPLIGIYNADNVPFCTGGGQSSFSNSCVATIKPAGLLYTTTATASTATGTGEQVLATYSLPANALDVTGRTLRIKAAFTAASNGNNKTFKLYFGASAITSGTLTTSGKNGVAELIVTKSGSSTQIVYGTMLVDTTPITPYVNASGSDTDTSAITIKFSGTDGTNSAGDIVLDSFTIEYLN